MRLYSFGTWRDPWHSTETRWGSRYGLSRDARRAAPFRRNGRRGGHHWQDRVSSSGLSLQLLDSFRRRQNQQFDFSYFGFAFHFFHDGQVSSAGADHQPAALPGYTLFHRDRRVSKGCAILFGRLFFAFTD